MNVNIKHLIVAGCTLLLLCAMLALTGCSSSEESAKETVPPPPSATEMMQKQLADLQTQSDSLKRVVSTLEQNNRTATAHSADLETQLAEMKDKLTAATAPPPKPSVENPRESYHKALELFHARNYSDAASLFQACLDAGIEEHLQDNCTYWIGECLYGQKQFNDAIEQLKKVFEYKISEKKDDSQIMVANSYLAMGKKVQARAEYEKLIKKFPASPFVKIAKEKLAKLGE